MAGCTRQLGLEFHSHGGRRPGAGRKTSPNTPGVSHHGRPLHDRRHPLHVTLRAAHGLPSLRRARLFAAIRRALAAASPDTFRVVHYSVKGNHVHLLVEAEGGGALSSGMQGLEIRVAKAVNRILQRHGSVWADRYHARPLRTPREVRHALVYVLMNAQKHRLMGAGIDPCSSGAWFDAWRERVPAPGRLAPVVRARTWLLGVAWRRGGPISLGDAPSGARRSRRGRRKRTSSVQSDSGIETP
jgi:hypothetical protein